jgi:hypothetical protein
MAISEKSRSALYQGFATIAPEDAVGEMLSYFPARDVEEPVTKELLHAEIADVRAEIADVRAEIADVRVEVAGLRTEMHTLANKLLVWLMGTIITTAGVAVAATVTLVG